MKKLFLFGIVGLLALGLGLAGCKKDEDEVVTETPTELEGTWMEAGSCSYDASEDTSGQDSQVFSGSNYYSYHHESSGRHGPLPGHGHS